MNKVKTGAEWLVTVDKAYGAKEKGDIISQHKTYEAAEKSYKRSGFASFHCIVAASGYREMGF
jgi:hypothetical protein